VAKISYRCPLCSNLAKESEAFARENAKLPKDTRSEEIELLKKRVEEQQLVFEEQQLALKNAEDALREAGDERHWKESDWNKLDKDISYPKWIADQYFEGRKNDW
jgi:hypothetical protein